MKEKTLLKIALICVILGLIGLYYVSGKIDVEEKEISRITSGDVDEDVKVTGLVSKVESRGNITIVEITQLEKIKVVLFDNNVPVLKGKYVDVYGSVEEYNGEMEIIGDVVRLK